MVWINAPLFDFGLLCCANKMFMENNLNLKLLQFSIVLARGEVLVLCETPEHFRASIKLLVHRKLDKFLFG